MEILGVTRVTGSQTIIKDGIFFLYYWNNCSSFKKMFRVQENVPHKKSSKCDLILKFPTQEI